jgi:hypothetical protein
MLEALIAARTRSVAFRAGRATLDRAYAEARQSGYLVA